MSSPNNSKTSIILGFLFLIITVIILWFIVFSNGNGNGEDNDEVLEIPSHWTPPEEFEEVRREAEIYCNSFSEEECEQQQYISHVESIWCTNSPCSCAWGYLQGEEVCNTTLMWD